MIQPERIQELLEKYDSLVIGLKSGEFVQVFEFIEVIDEVISFRDGADHEVLIPTECIEYVEIVR